MWKDNCILIQLLFYMRKTLPTFYYLQHFKEFLDYFAGEHKALLNAKAQDFIQTFYGADKSEQAMIARLASRKHAVIAIKTLLYDEIKNPNEVLERLRTCGLISSASNASNTMLVTALAKAELFEILEILQIPLPKTSIKQAELHDYFCNQIDDRNKSKISALPYVVRQFDSTLKFLLFIYFGHLNGKLNQFSMRDLGILRTRADAVTGEAKFENAMDAQSAFYYACLRESISNKTVLEPPALNALPSVSSAHASQIKSKCLYELGRYFLQSNRQYSLEAWLASNTDTAIESWIREKYKDGAKTDVANKLLSIIENGASESLLYFAEDFYARKYNKKRTSLLTDMLRDATHTLSIDSRYNQMVEQGVIAYYSRNNIKAFRTENQLWKSLFGLVFWPILYEQESANLSNEFERMPPSLKTNQFYHEHTNSIENALAALQTHNGLYQLLVKHAARYYGKTNSIFMWRKNLLEHLQILVMHTPIEQLVGYLHTMTKDYASLKDGYPDIMLLDNGALRFEEIKATGDSLRRNQLVTLQKLKQHGFDVHITQVEWVRDPNQVYAVVDIETTGGKAEHHRITEIGIVKMQGNNVIDSWQSLINPQRPIPSSITRLTGITNEMVANAPVFADIADQLDEFTQDTIFVAHNVNFDLGFIKQEFARLERYYRRPKLCTVQQCRRVFPNLPSYSLANLTAHFNISMDHHHRALSDAKAAAQLLVLILQDEEK